MGAASGSGGTGTPRDEGIAEALRALQKEQERLREKVEGAMKEGGPITMLANELLTIRTDIEKTVPAIEKSIEALRRSVHPVSKIEKMALVVGVVVITNLALRLISGTLESPFRHGTGARGILQGVSYLLTP